MGAPPLYIGATGDPQMLPKVGEEDINAIGTFLEEQEIEEGNEDGDNDQIVPDETSLQDDKIESNNEIDPEKEEEIDVSAEQTDAVENDGTLKINDTVPGDISENENANGSIGSNDNASNAIDNDDNVANTDVAQGDIEVDEDDQPNDDAKTTDSIAEPSQDQETQVDDEILQENQVPIDADDDEDVVSPKEVSREGSAQSIRSANLISPIITSPKSHQGSTKVSSRMLHISRSASRLSVNKSPRKASSPTVSKRSASPRNSPLPGTLSPNIGASASRKSSLQISSRASSRAGPTKLGIQIEKNMQIFYLTFSFSFFSPKISEFFHTFKL